MESFISDVHSSSSDVKGSILSQLADSCASGLVLLTGFHVVVSDGDASKSLHCQLLLLLTL